MWFISKVRDTFIKILMNTRSKLLQECSFENLFKFNLRILWFSLIKSYLNSWPSYLHLSCHGWGSQSSHCTCSLFSMPNLPGCFLLIFSCPNVSFSRRKWPVLAQTILLQRSIFKNTISWLFRIIFIKVSAIPKSGPYVHFCCCFS